MKNLKINAIANFMVKLLNIAFPLITGPYLARVLDVNKFGYFNIANNFVALIIPLAGFGIYNYGIREISKVKDDKDKISLVFSKLFYFSIITVIFFTAIFYICIYLFNQNYDIKVLSFILGIQIFGQLFYIEWMNEAFENYTFILYKTLIIRFILLISIFIFVRNKNDIIPYAVVNSIITILNFLISYLWIKKDVKFIKINIKEIVKLFVPLFSMFLLTNANLLYTVLDKLFLSYSNRPEYVTYYTLSQNIVTIIAGVILSAVTVNIPRMGYYLGKKDIKSYNYLLRLTSRLFLFILMPLSIGIFMVGSYGILIYAGAKYLNAGIVTSLFGIRCITWSIDVIFGSLIIFINGYEKMLTKVYFVGGIINFILNSILFINRIYKPEFYIGTTIISELLIIFLEVYIINKYKMSDICEILFNILKYISISLFFIPLFYIFKAIYRLELVLNLHNIIGILIYIILSVIGYILILLLIKDTTINYIVNLIKKMLNKIRS